MPGVIGIGKQDFASLREGNYFYVDKTRLISEWWESGDEITLITRPRRFGKTLNMSMLDCFFSNRYKGRQDLSSFKTNPYLERGMMTGITRVSKESVFSDLNNLSVVTTTSEHYTGIQGSGNRGGFAGGHGLRSAQADKG